MVDVMDSFSNLFAAKHDCKLSDIALHVIKVKHICIAKYFFIYNILGVCILNVLCE